MNPPKEERNKRIVKLRLENPKKWSFGRLGEEFNITREAAYQIYQRDLPRFARVEDNS